jgi:hypothetical protein
MSRSNVGSWTRRGDFQWPTTSISLGSATTICMGKVTNDLPVMMQANDLDGLASAVSEAKFSACAAKRRVRHNQGVNPPSKSAKKLARNCVLPDLPLAQAPV